VKIFGIKRLWLISALFLVVFAFSGCASVMQQLNGMATLTKCQFRLASVEGTTLAGISLQGDASQMGVMSLLKLQETFATGTLPLRFTLYVEVKNPNTSAAGMSQMEWTLYMDGNPLTNGVLVKSVSIAPNNGVGVLPVEVQLDLKKALSGKNLDSMINLAKNVAGEGTQPTRLTMQVKPSMKVGRQELQYPGYIKVTHEFASK
jgi:hypothetical protein